MTFRNDEPIDEPIEDAEAVDPAAESPVDAEIVRPLRVWTVFAVFVGAAVAAIVAQIPVVIVFVLIKVAEGDKPESGLDFVATPWGFVATVLPAQLAILAAWWLASSFGDSRALAYRAIG